MGYRIDVKDLPLRYQRQAIYQIAKQRGNGTLRALASDQPHNGEDFTNSIEMPMEKPATKQKGHSQAVEMTNGIKFHFKAELRRYTELMALMGTGEISDLRLEPQFTLLEGYKKSDGSTVKRLCYTADFSYIRDGKLVVEDVELPVTKTEAYGMRKTLMKDRYGIDIVEIMY